jgi:hypothetical protein
MEQSFIVNRVWTEMYRIKSWLIQIDIYTDRKRRNSKYVSIIIIGTALLCLICAIVQLILKIFFQDFAPLCNWIIGVSSIIAAIATTIKDFMPHVMQPERELCDLDRLHEFYSSYFQKLEKAFILRYDPNSDMNDTKLTQCFDRIVSTEGENQSKMKHLIHKLKNKEKRMIDKRTDDYFNVTYKFQ